ncbi:extracellular solute-binding protein [Komagataeibacter medellinensis]|nr:extracellular solute-binding protein [Komagataeibacter medellinensis]
MFQPVIRSPARFALFCLVAAMAMLSVAQAIPAQGAVRVRHRPALVVASAESHLEPVQDAVFFRPFMQESGLSVTHRAWDGSLTELDRHGLHAAAADTWSLVFTEDSTIRAACMDGLLVRLAGSATNPDGCGVPGLTTQVVVAWDPTWRQVAPQWGDFWDVVRFPGKRGLRRDPRTTLEIALMADGVAPGDVYAQLSTDAGVDRAFRKLSQLRPYITWWSTPQQAASILAHGQVLMSSAPSDAVMMSPAQGRRVIGVSTDMALSYGLSWGVVAGQVAARLGQSRELLHFIVQPDRRDNFTTHYATTPRPDAGHPARVLPMDVQFWQAHYATLSHRFDIWLRGAG